ncbi:MAG: aminomethyl transferase family protein [Gammaproteobacteria bacterium]|nr:aminomethyl transferase family protein [Gammaproteobacteria bacterium]
MTELTRSSALASRHTALGSGLEDWNGMGTAWSYNSNPNDEHDAVREAAGLFDMSALKKVTIRGKDAHKVADHVITRDMTKVGPGQSTYGAVLTDIGTVCDDAILANNGNDEWLLCHGSGDSMARLLESAEGLNADIELDDDLHNISLQGPKAMPLLNAHTPMELEKLAYFHHQATELFGHPCRLSRTGYSGERGYEILAPASAVVDIWDNIRGHGASEGVIPCSFTALDKVRIEAGLLFYGYDMTDEHSPWEVGLGFTVNRNKGTFRGQDKVFELASSARFQAAGISIDHTDAVVGGERLMLDGQDVGVVNSPAWSHRLKKSLALVHLQQGAANLGTKLEVVSDDFNGSAVVERSPFFDPSKGRTHS